MVWVVALMSGLFSLYREAVGLYQGQIASTPRSTFEHCAIIAFIISAAIVWTQERHARRRLEARFRGSPNLTLRGNAFGEETRYTIVPIPGGTRTKSVPFSCVILRITNDAATSAPDSVAKQVGAFLAFYNADGRFLFSFAGRWGDTPQPPHLQQNQVPFELLNVDFPIGGTRELNIAIKYLEDAECYGVNNDSYGYPPYFNNPRWRLDGQRFRVDIRVQGVYVDRSWTVHFANLGVGGGLEAVSFEDAASGAPR